MGRGTIMGRKVYFYDVEGVEKTSVMERIKEVMNRLKAEYRKRGVISK